MAEYEEVLRVWAARRLSKDVRQIKGVTFDHDSGYAYSSYTWEDEVFRATVEGHDLSDITPEHYRQTVSRRRAIGSEGIREAEERIDAEVLRFRTGARRIEFDGGDFADVLDGLVDVNRDIVMAGNTVMPYEPLED